MPATDAQIAAAVAALKASLTPDQIDLVLILVNILLSSDRRAHREDGE